MSVKLTKTYDFTTLLVLADFVNLKAIMPFFSEISADLENANKLCVMLLTMAFRNYKVEDIHFFTEKALMFLFVTPQTTVLFTSLL